MKCIKCEKEARAVCQLCGRAVCEDHIEEKRFASGFSAPGGIFTFKYNAVSLNDAVWCGLCHPEYESPP